MGSFLDLVSTLHTELVNIAHLLIETSCNLFFQPSKASPESDVHELAHLQVRFPSAVRLVNLLVYL